MRANRYLHIAVIVATLLLLVLWETNAAGPPEKPGNPGLPGCLAKVSELEDIVANQQETILQQDAQIEELEYMLQNFAPVPKTGQTQSYAPGDDGDLQLGVQWPDPRFTENGDGTVKDHLTDLIWLKNANCFGPDNTWYEALDASNKLADGQCGLSDDSSPGDWHLPNIWELLSLIDYSRFGLALPSGHPFSGVQSYFYWSSTPHAHVYVSAWLVYMSHGSMYYMNKDNTFYVWPVRVDN